MKPEIEAKFIDVNFDEIREKLVRIGAKCVQPMCIMRRKNFDYVNGQLESIGGWVRVRDEGDKVTLAYKQLNNREIDGTHEVSVTVSDFDDTANLLLAIGLKQTSYRETKREIWESEGVQNELDEWPWVSPFIEIEANDAASLFATVSKLDLNKSDALYGSVGIVYGKKYKVTESEVDAWSEITFAPVPIWLEEKRR